MELLPPSVPPRALLFVRPARHCTEPERAITHFPVPFQALCVLLPDPQTITRARCHPSSPSPGIKQSLFSLTLSRPAFPSGSRPASPPETAPRTHSRAPARDLAFQSATCTGVHNLVTGAGTALGRNESIISLSPPINSCPELRHSFSHHHSFPPTQTNNRLFSSSLFMSSTEQTTISSSNLQLIIDALCGYSRRMGIDFAQNSFAEELQCTNTPNDILNLLQGREQAFIQYRNKNRTLINCFSPAVRVLQIFSDKLGDAFSLVSLNTPFLLSFPVIILTQPR